MKRAIVIILTAFLLAGCAGLSKTSSDRNDEKYGPMAIRLADFSWQVVIYYRNKKEAIPSDFDANQFIQILRQLPSDQVQQNDVDAMVADFKVKARALDNGFSVMLCQDNDKKIMEDFANLLSSSCRFDPKKAELRLWNESQPCSFESHWKKFCRVEN